MTARVALQSAVGQLFDELRRRRDRPAGEDLRDGRLGGWDTSRHDSKTITLIPRGTVRVERAKLTAESFVSK
jgi:hypothetical protein